ncbi:hypothetical protein ES703_113103 [subsurface metagenome]
MQIVHYIPGAVGAGAPGHTLPLTAPDIDVLIDAEITRLPTALADHPELDIVNTLLAHPEAQVPAALGVHTLTPDTAIGGPITNALGEDGAGALETAAAAAVGMPTCIDAHAVSGVPNDLAHAVSGVPNDVVHAGGNPVVAVPNAIKLTTRTFTLDVATLVGDLLTVTYLEVGERVAVS